MSRRLNKQAIEKYTKGDPLTARECQRVLRAKRKAMRTRFGGFVVFGWEASRSASAFLRFSASTFLAGALESGDLDG